jgi:hypothetical protein
MKFVSFCPILLFVVHNANCYNIFRVYNHFDAIVCYSFNSLKKILSNVDNKKRPQDSKCVGPLVERPTQTDKGEGKSPNLSAARSKRSKTDQI